MALFFWSSKVKVTLRVGSQSAPSYATQITESEQSLSTSCLRSGLLRNPGTIREILSQNQSTSAVERYRYSHKSSEKNSKNITEHYW